MEISLATLEASHNRFADGPESRKYAITFDGGGLKALLMPSVQVTVQSCYRHRALNIPLVPLEHQRKVTQVTDQPTHISLQLNQALEVLLQLVGLGVDDKHYAVYSVQYRKSSAFVQHLTRNRIQMKPYPEVVN